MLLLRERFVARCADDLETLKMLSGGNLQAAQMQSLVHSLAGAAGTFGFPAVSEAAGRLDDVYALGQSPHQDMVTALLSELQRLVDG